MSIHRALLLGLLPALLLGLSAACSQPQPEPPSRPSPAVLEGQAWVLLSLRGESLTATPPERRPRIELRDGRLSGTGGCNRLMGSYRLDGIRLRFEPPAGTRMHCGDAMALEQAFLGLFGEVAAWRAAGTGIEWLDGEGRVLAAFGEAAQQYRCDDGSLLRVRYAAEGIALSHAGRDYAMYSVRAASGARYATEQGRRTDWSLEWHVKGDEGLLLEAPLSDSRKPEDLQRIARCRAG